MTQVERGCLRKRRYPTRMMAEGAAERNSRTMHRSRHLSVYECRFCGGWHLTHQEQRTG